jgi:hypothetical protein
MAEYKIEIKSPDKVRFVVELLKEYGLYEKRPGFFTDKKPESKKVLKTVPQPR